MQGGEVWRALEKVRLAISDKEVTRLSWCLRVVIEVLTIEELTTAGYRVTTAGSRLLLLVRRIDQGLGSTSGIRACALRNFDLEVMELENTQNNALAKLPMLKLEEYEMWKIRIKQYFQIQDYAL
ncbi:hypothetical protein Tco_0086404 [Tanacetum coccineum]